MTASDDQFSERLTDWEPRLAVDRLCATGAVTLPRQRRRRWSWAQIAEFVLTGVVVVGVAFVAGWGLGVPS